MSTINYTYNVIVDRFRQFAAGHFQLRRFTHGEISQADLEKEAEWPWLHVKPRAINYSPGTRSFQFEIFISDLPRDKEDKTGYQAESITDCSLIFQDLINEIYLGNMFGSDVVLTRPVSSEPFVEQYTHTLTGVTGTIELNLDYDWSACSIPASWNYNTPTDSGSDGWGALQFIESLDQNGVFVSLDGDVEAPGNSYYYGTNSSGVKGWYQLIDQVGITCEDLPECATIISIVDDIEALQTDVTALQTDVTDLETNKVPYTGATGNVDLGEYELKAGQVEFDQTPTGSAGVGVMRWNDTDGTVDVGLKGGNVRLQIGQEEVVRVVNKTGATLNESAYQAVRVRSVSEGGAQGQRLAVVLAQANNDANSATTIGIVTETIDNNQEGFITTNGNVNNINTTGSLQGETWVDGDILYLSGTTAGQLTNVKPSAPTHTIIVGYVVYAHANNGKIFVKVDNGYELDELHNVYIDTPLNNNVLTYESSTSLWKNKTVATALGYTPANAATTLTINGTTQDLSANRTFTIATGLTVGSTPITSGTVGRVLFEGTGNVLQEDSALSWDNTNKRLNLSSGLDNLLNLTPQSGGNAIVVNTSGYIKWENAALDTYIRGNNGFFVLDNGYTARFQVPFGSAAYINTGQNFLIGTTTDAGFKLDVNGTTRLNGLSSINGAGVANTALAVYGNGNGGGNYLFRMYDASAVERFYLTASGNFRLNGATDTSTTGTDEKWRMVLNFAPTSGTRQHNGIYLTQTINQTGGANGITRGLLIEPTLTAAADYRAIETTRGRIVFGNLPTSSAGLPTGALWNDAGTVKIV
jgi:hypothetical protein